MKQAKVTQVVAICVGGLLLILSVAVIFWPAARQEPVRGLILVLMILHLWMETRSLALGDRSHPWKISLTDLHAAFQRQGTTWWGLTRATISLVAIAATLVFNFGSAPPV